MRFRNTIIAIVFSQISICTPIALCQDTTPPTKETTIETGHAATEESKLPEAEFVASTVFRSAALIQPLWRQLNFEGHYFGGTENNVGYTAGSWNFKGEHWKLVPGFGVEFGDNGFQTMPAASLRWAYERSWFVSEGLLVQGLARTTFVAESSESEGGEPATKSVFPFIADGDHVSARWERLTVGGTWEHIHFREGEEWKGGLRAAFRVLPSLSFTFFAMGPNAEIRGGILFEPPEKK